MPRVPGTYTRDGEWELVANPNFAGRKPSIQHAECHDRTPFVTCACRCGAVMHYHEGQRLPADVEIATTCKACGNLLVFPPGWFANAFATMREEGWIE